MIPVVIGIAAMLGILINRNSMANASPLLPRRRAIASDLKITAAEASGCLGPMKDSDHDRPI
jgi:hypothetical protein